MILPEELQRMKDRVKFLEDTAFQLQWEADQIRKEIRERCEHQWEFVAKTEKDIVKYCQTCGNFEI